MRIVVAPDSFKGSLSAAEACAAIEAGLRAVWGDSVEIISVPMADGGEGTVEALVGATGGRIVPVTVTGPLGEPVSAFYGLLGDGRTAALEMAAASGLTLVPPSRRDPTVTTTYGTGELIAHAVAQGAQRLIIGVGGSATNDGGAGAAQAMGFRLLDVNGEDVGFGGGALNRLVCIETPEEVRRRYAGIEVLVACDVRNPLCGPQGASHVYGPQKGASEEQVALLDAALRHYADVVARDLGVSIHDLEGAGAAGGLGGGLAAFLNSQLVPGVEIVMQALDLHAKLAIADLCITGEGHLDSQTLSGKVPAGVARAAMRHGVPVIAIGGSVAPSARAELEAEFAAVIAALDEPVTVDQAMATASVSLSSAARQVGRILNLGLEADE